MKPKLILGARILLGLIFFIFGLNGFLQFMPQPDLPPAGAKAIGALFSLGYLMPIVKGVEVLVGVALLTGRFVPLALTVLAPVSLNIFLFHAIAAPAGLPMAIIVLALQIYLAVAYKSAFRPLLEANTQPGT